MGGGGGREGDGGGREGGGRGRLEGEGGGQRRRPGARASAAAGVSLILFLQKIKKICRGLCLRVGGRQRALAEAAGAASPLPRLEDNLG